jgi:hypothetical protein
MRTSKTSLAALLLLLTGGCIRSTGRLDQNRFQHRDYPYAVFYTETYGRADAPLGPDWKVENFRFPDKRHAYPKADVGYTTLRGYDTNRDGQRDLTREEPFYDLLLAHARPSGALWLRTVPLSRADEQLDAAELAQRYVAAAEEQGRVAAAFGIELEALPGRSQLGAGKACELSKRPAYRVDFTLPAVTSGERSAHRPARAGSVVVVETPYRSQHDQRVVLIAGFSSSPEHTAELEPGFDKLLSRTVLGELHAGLSMKGGHTCTRSAESAAPVDAPPLAEDASQADEQVWEPAPPSTIDGAPVESPAPAAVEQPGPVEPPSSGGEAAP